MVLTFKHLYLMSYSRKAKIEFTIDIRIVVPVIPLFFKQFSFEIRKYPFFKNKFDEICCK